MAGDAAVVQYPKRFTLPDESEDLDRAITLLEKLGSKLGPEGTLYAIKQAVSAALSLSDEDLSEVMDEVEAKLAESPKAAPAAAQPNNEDIHGNQQHGPQQQQPGNQLPAESDVGSAAASAADATD
jgi:hypothetical protein